MLYRCPYEDGHVYVYSKVGWLAHPVPGHGKKSGYAPGQQSRWWQRLIEMLRWQDLSLERKYIMRYIFIKFGYL